jgi:hypothetical protein
MLRTFVVHSGPAWPRPLGPTPDSPFESRTIEGTTYPIGVSWPPPIRIPLTAAQSALKLQALEADHSQLEVRSTVYIWSRSSSLRRSSGLGNSAIWGPKPYASAP